MTVSEQVAPVVKAMRDRSEQGLQIGDRRYMEWWTLADGIRDMAFEIDRLRARLRLVGVALTLLAISAAAVMLR